MMNPFREIWKGYLRWRHSHGFGVHSPYAYHIVTGVIRPGDYGYYGYHIIDRKLRASKVSETNILSKKNLYLILRLLINAPFKRLILFPSINPILKAMADYCGVKCCVLNCKKEDFYGYGDLLCLDQSSLPATMLSDLIEKGVSILVFNPDVTIRESLKTPLERGVFFEGKNICLLIPRREMAYVAYSMKF